MSNKNIIDTLHICTYIFVMQYEWDKNKNQINQRKHRLSFELASKVFDDPLRIISARKATSHERRQYEQG